MILKIIILNFKIIKILAAPENIADSIPYMSLPIEVGYLLWDRGIAEKKGCLLEKH
jgi:folate-binding Fe-S cluster repair protein YgfZ